MENLEFLIHVNNVITNVEGEILLVQERKPSSFGKYNLPGGHLEYGEHILTCAKREAMEEVKLDINPRYFIGAFTGYGQKHFINFVFHSEISNQVAVPQHSEILDCQWFSLDEINRLEEEEILNPRKLKLILKKHVNKEYFPLSVIEELF